MRKTFALLGAVAAISLGAVACYKNPNAGKPIKPGEIRLSFAQANPKRAQVDATLAINRGDRHLVVVYRYTEVVPGVEHPEALAVPVLFIEDTGDQVRGPIHSLFNKRAEEYAIAYNREVLMARNN